MSVFVWAMTAIAIWHFTVFLPDRFWGGIVGAFLASLIGALVFGAILLAAGISELGDPSIVTMVEGVIGGGIGLGVSYAVGIRRGELPDV